MTIVDFRARISQNRPNQSFFSLSRKTSGFRCRQQDGEEGNQLTQSSSFLHRNHFASFSPVVLSPFLPFYGM